MPTSPSDHPATNGDEARVIVVDDAVDVAEAMAFALESDGYKVWIAHDGNEALKMVDEHHPHCVLFDIDMPGLDGSELSKRLRDAHGASSASQADQDLNQCEAKLADYTDRVFRALNEG